MRREVGALLAAVSLHLGLIQVARSLPPIVWPVEAAPAVAIELEVLEGEAPRAAEPVREEPSSATRTPTAPTETAPRDAAPAAGRASLDAPAPSREPATPAALPEAPASGAGPEVATANPEAATANPDVAPPGPSAPSPGSEDGWSTDEPAALAGAWGALPLWARPEGGFAPSRGAPAATQAPASPAVDREAANRVLSSTLRARDKELGISVPAAQVVVGAVADATRAVPVPHGTRASFEVRLDGAGRVTSARVIKSSGGDAQSWGRAAGAVAAQLSARQLVMGEDGAKQGATVLVEVKTKHVYPAGTSKRADVKPVCANQILNDLAEGASRSAEATPTEGATLFTDEHGRPCIPVGVAGISDVSNLGANKQIQVETRVSVKLPDAPDLPHDIQPVDTSAPWVKLGDSTAPRPTMPFRIRKREKERAKKR